MSFNDFTALAVDLSKFADSAKQWREDIVDGVTDVLTNAGEAWVAGAARRVPVDKGRLKSSIVAAPVQYIRGSLVLVVGTDVTYSLYVEFGTKFIAGGDVLALGQSPEITDAMAVRDWPALRERSGSGQQMPWFRPAFQDIRPTVESDLEAAVFVAE
jgi:hypothetical protein